MPSTALTSLPSVYAEYSSVSLSSCWSPTLTSTPVISYPSSLGEVTPVKLPLASWLSFTVQITCGAWALLSSTTHVPSACCLAFTNSPVTLST